MDIRPSYHGFVPSPDHLLVRGLDKTDPYRYSEAILSHPQVQPIAENWKANLESPFQGITSDGIKKENLYSLQDEVAPTKEAVAAALRVLSSLNRVEKSKVQYSLDSETWRKWCNPELIIYDVGLRLEHLEQSQIDLIMDLLAVSLSPAGFAKARAAIKTNRFLGELCHCSSILNEQSYFFFISGEPSETEPWGYNFFGHHLCLSVFFVGPQMTVSPVFIGAEPNLIDAGPDAGIRICIDEAEMGLQLMQSLCTGLQKKAQVYEALHDPAMPDGRWNLADQRHMAGAFQDNRTIPYEGITATELTSAQRNILLEAIRAFLVFLPAQTLHHRMSQIEQHLSDTYFCWIGGYGPDDPFYYRIQSPVVLVEFDHHSGVFLTNEEPAKYHVHTIVRTPNGNDYARELVRLQKLAK